MTRKILYPTADPVFKRIFGQEKAITIEIINLLIKPPNPVVDLEYLPNEMFHDINDGKISIVDVRCLDSMKQQFIIEMQLVHHAGFNQRALLYAAKAYGQQLRKGMAYNDAQSVYLLSIVNHSFKPDPNKWLHKIEMLDRTDPDFEVPGITLLFLELAKRKKLGNFNFDDPVDRWLSFLAEPEKILTMPKYDLSVYPNLLKAAELLDESNYTQEQLNAYDRHLLAVYDINMSRIESFDEGVEVGEARGVEKGHKQGLEQGREEGIHLSIPIIKELLKGDLTHEQIAQRYSVSVQLVAKLAEELN
jgi:predicted transposase/invertase (TIGR01784 family)